MEPHEQLCDLLERSLIENPPLSVKEGGLILDDFSKELDERNDIQLNSKNWKINYEAKQKELTGIKTMKVGYNRVTTFILKFQKVQ